MSTPSSLCLFFLLFFFFFFFFFSRYFHLACNSRILEIGVTFVEELVL